MIGDRNEGLFRSDDEGRSFIRIGDDLHRYGRLLSMAAHLVMLAVVLIATRRMAPLR